MASGAKFDAWHRTSGGVNNNVIQTVWGKKSDVVQVSTTGAPQLFWDFPQIVRTQPNSTFLIMLVAQVSYGNSVAGNPDSENPSLHIYRNGTPLGFDTSFDGYSSCFWGTDVPFTGAGSYGGTYDIQNKTTQYYDNPPGEIGESYQYSLYARGNSLRLNSRITGASANWAVSTVTIMEISQ